MSRKHTSFVAALVLAAAGLVAAPSVAAPAEGKPGGKCNRTNNSVSKLLECVTLEGVMEHQRKLQAVADANGGTRASGTPGYDASAAYIKDRMQRAGYTVRVQEFDFYEFAEAGPSELEQVSPNPRTYVEDSEFAATPHSEPGEISAPVTPVDVMLGAGNTSTSGCDDSDFDTFTAGHIALLQRGSCTFEIKAENAAEAGAVGLLFFNQGDNATPARQGIPAVTLGNGYTGGLPALSTTYAIGEELSGTADLVMRLFANVTREASVTSNVIAESRGGDPANVVMAGAHLDSVPEGPGINDNGSGSSALLEVAEQLTKVRTTNKMRFAWWGAEEGGLVGSSYYVNDLAANAPDELDAIEMYLNFDMVGSPNYGLFRYDGDGSSFGTAGPDGSDEIEALFTRYYEQVRGVPTEASPFNGRSDYQAFILNGVPSGGLFTGAEGQKTAAQVTKWGGSVGPYDPCYHSACDTIANLSPVALDINADAIAYAIFLFASGQEVLND